jgi:hypothetical protein
MDLSNQYTPSFRATSNVRYQHLHSSSVSQHGVRTRIHPSLGTSILRIFPQTSLHWKPRHFHLGKISIANSYLGHAYCCQATKTISIFADMSILVLRGSALPSPEGSRTNFTHQSLPSPVQLTVSCLHRSCRQCVCPVRHLLLGHW